MKALMIAAALLVLGASSSFATNQDRVPSGGDSMTVSECWYNDRGAFTGAHGTADVPFETRKGRPNSSNAWGYSVAGGPESCPKKLPNR